MILGYLDNNEKNIDVEKQRRQILDYASENGLVVDMFLQESKIEALKSSIKTDNHTLIVANIIALGMSLLQIKESISILAKMNVTVISVQEGYVWAPKDLRALPRWLDVVIDIRSSISSLLTCRALAERKAQGVRLGRKTPNKKRVFDGREEEIKQKLADGVTKVQIARDFGVAQATLYAFLRQHPELKPQNVRSMCRLRKLENKRSCNA